MDQRGEDHGWHTDGDMVRSAYQLHAEDHDFGQNVAGHLGTVQQAILERALAYWRSIDKALDDQIAGKLGNQA